MTKTTRATKVKSSPTETKSNNITTLRKILYISESLLDADQTELRMERFYHPGKARSALFVTVPTTNTIMEVLQYTEPRRSWLINNDVCSNGRIYMASPIDATFLALHHLRKHCSTKAMALDSIHDEKDTSTNRLLTHFVNEAQLSAVADVKRSGDMCFYKYNPERTLAWLALKTQQVVLALKAANVHCGHSALSQNYQRSEKVEHEKIDNEMDYVRMACDIIGDYLELELYDELKTYLCIPNEMQALADEKANAQKRKSEQNLKTNDNKKIKLETKEANGASDQLKSSSLLDTSTEEGTTPKTPLKERILTAKEKALAKSAKGTKSIASFFKK